MQPTGWGTARHTAACPNILDFSVFRAIVKTEGKGVSHHFITEASSMEVKKVLCAVDLEDTIAPSVEYAKMMASMTGASILVAYVIPAHTPYEDVYLSVNNQPNEVNNPNETIQKSMNALLAEQFAGMDATGVILVGRPSEELVKLAEEKGASLIVMGTHGRAGFDRLLFGSVAHEVVRAAPCPLMTVRPPMPKK